MNSRCRWAARLRVWKRQRRLYVIIALSILAAAPFVYLGARSAIVICSRIGVFHELEFQEGDMALDAMRVLEGKSLYPERYSSHLPLLYTPLMSYVSTLSMRLFGSTALWTGRLVSLLSTFGILALLGAWVWRETRSALGIVAAVGLFISINPLVGWWFDLFRADMLAMLLSVGAAWLCLDRRSSDRMEIAKGLVAGLLWTLAFLTKQSAGPLAVAFSAMALFISPLRGVWCGAAGLAFGQVALGWLTIRNANFWFLAIDIFRVQGLNLANWRERFMELFVWPASIPLAIIAAWWIMAIIRRRWRWILAGPVLVLAIALSLRGLIKLGGYVNHFLPAWLFVSVWFGVAVGSIAPESGSKSPRGRRWRETAMDILRNRLGPRRKQWRSRPSPWPAALLLVVSISMLFKSNALERPSSVFGYLNPFAWKGQDSLDRHIPRDLESGREMIQDLARLDGGVWVPHHNYYAHLAGLEPDISIDTPRDLNWAGHPTPPCIFQIIRSGKYRYILLDNVTIAHDWLPRGAREEIERRYVLVENWEMKYGPNALRPVDQTAQKPRALWMRRDAVRR